MARAKLKLRQGDQVRVVSGAHRGSEGKIMVVMPEKNRVIIENVNVIKKAQRPTQENPRGGYVEHEAAINASNVQILDPQTGEPTRIAYKIETTGKVRVSAKTGAQLDQ